MARIPKSKTMAAVHETMADLHAAGAIDDSRMREFDEMCLSREPQKKSTLTFNVFKDPSGQWRWHLIASNGKVIAESGEGYRLKRDCLAAIEAGFARMEAAERDEDDPLEADIAFHVAILQASARKGPTSGMPW